MLWHVHPIAGCYLEDATCPKWLCKLYVHLIQAWSLWDNLGLSVLLEDTILMACRSFIGGLGCTSFQSFTSPKPLYPINTKLCDSLRSPTKRSTKGLTIQQIFSNCSISLLRCVILPGFNKSLCSSNRCCVQGCSLLSQVFIFVPSKADFLVNSQYVCLGLLLICILSFQVLLLRSLFLWSSLSLVLQSF